MQLSANFTLDEMTKSQTATRLGIKNQPSKDEVENLRQLCVHVLQPVRSHFAKSVTVSSGYRSPELSKQIGSSAKSQHCKGMAADIEIMGTSNKELATWIHTNCNYDQLILEFHNLEEPNSGWVHVSYTGDSCRFQYLRAFKDENLKTRYVSCQ